MTVQFTMEKKKIENWAVPIPINRSEAEIGAAQINLTFLNEEFGQGGN